MASASHFAALPSPPCPLSRGEGGSGSATGNRPSPPSTPWRGEGGEAIAATLPREADARCWRGRSGWHFRHMARLLLLEEAGDLDRIELRVGRLDTKEERVARCKREVRVIE